MTKDVRQPFIMTVVRNIGLVAAPAAAATAFGAVVLSSSWLLGTYSGSLIVVIWGVAVVLGAVVLLIVQGLIVLPLVTIATRRGNRWLHAAAFLPAVSLVAVLIYQTRSDIYNTFYFNVLVAIFAVGAPLVLLPVITAELLRATRTAANHSTPRVPSQSRSPIFVAVIAIAAVLSGTLVARETGRSSVATILNVALPRSLKATRCVDYGFSNVEINCFFEVNTRDFDALLAAHPFESTPFSAQAHSGAGPNIGPDFRLAEKLDAPLPSGRQGLIRLMTDSSRTRVLLHYYVE